MKKKVRGHVFVSRLDGEFYLPGFRFIGETVPDTFFWLDTTVLATDNGWISGRSGLFTIMSTYDNIDFKVSLPVGYTNVSYFRSLTVWCRKARASFGYVEIPTSNIVNPFTCANYGPVSAILSPPVHIPSGDAYVIGPRSIAYTEFTFDGTAPASWYWLGPITGSDTSNLTDGIIIPDEIGSLYRLVQFTNITIAVKLPLGYSLCSLPFF
ncbi:DM13 domain-containing protein, partial [Salmonella sp. s51228]|uniref:DM13 domain-containing protein n=1 Tax=Salmonella sp. s51228 TaxID=3159652 RepID=UPI003980A651